MTVGIGCAVLVLATLLVALAKRSDDLYRIGRRTYLARTWRVRIVCGNEECGAYNFGYGYRRRDVVRMVRTLRRLHRWSRGSYVAWQWEVTRQGHVLWRGKTHRVSNRRNK